MFSVTLKDLRENHACHQGYNKVVRALQGETFSQEDDGRESYIKFPHKEQIPLLFILNSNGLEDAFWSLRCIYGKDRDLRLYAVWCARQVQHLMTDKRSLNALDVAERHANGQASDAELKAAWAAAADAAAGAAVDAAWAAAWATAWAANATAARAAAWAAADAAWAANAADWAADAAWAAADASARTAARAAQEGMFIKMCQGTAPWQNKVSYHQC